MTNDKITKPSEEVLRIYANGLDDIRDIIHRIEAETSILEAYCKVSEKTGGVINASDWPKIAKELGEIVGAGKDEVSKARIKKLFDKYNQPPEAA